MTVWKLAWRSTLRRRRLFVWNVVIPLLLLTPVALSEAAAPHRVAVFGVFLVFFGAFGSAIPAVRDARDGWLDEVFRAGYAPWRWLLERTAAETSIDVLQTLPALLVLLVTAGGVNAAGAVLGGLLLALFFANLVGPLVAAAVRSLAEAALACAALSLLLLHLAAFFRTPAAGWGSVAATWSPYAALRTGLQAGVPTPGQVSFGWMSAALIVVTATVLIAVTSPLWTGRLRWPRNR